MSSIYVKLLHILQRLVFLWENGHLKIIENQKGCDCNVYKIKILEEKKLSHYASKLTFNAEQMVAGTLFVQTQINCPLEFKKCLPPYDLCLKFFGCH